MSLYWHELQSPKANFEVLSSELHDCPEKEKADDIQSELHVLNKGHDLSSLRDLDTKSEFFNEFQVASSLSLLVDLSTKNCQYITLDNETKEQRSVAY